MLIMLNKEKYSLNSKIIENSVSITYAEKATKNKEEKTNEFRFTKQDHQIIYDDTSGQSKIVYFARNNNKIYAYVDGECFFLEEVEDVRNFGDRDGNDLEEEHLKSPMPGVIVKVCVSKGDKVKEGDAIVIIEAMKMETTLFASIDGEITKIHVKEKEQVDSDYVLVEIKK